MYIASLSHSDMYVCICSEVSYKAVGSNGGPKVISKHRDGSISSRPPQPVPRPPKNMHRQAQSALLDSSSLHAPLNNHRRYSGMENL